MYVSAWWFLFSIGLAMCVCVHFSLKNTLRSEVGENWGWEVGIRTLQMICLYRQPTKDYQVCQKWNMSFGWHTVDKHLSCTSLIFENLVSGCIITLRFQQNFKLKLFLQILLNADLFRSLQFTCSTVIFIKQHSVFWVIFGKGSLVGLHWRGLPCNFLWRWWLLTRPLLKTQVKPWWQGWVGEHSSWHQERNLEMSWR